MMRKCRITVLKTTFDRELADEYGVEGFGPCQIMHPGQEFVTACDKPAGLCDEAWKGMQHFVFALAHGGGEDGFFNNDWIREPDVAICSCNDGLRPVIFKVEALQA